MISRTNAPGRKIKRLLKTFKLSQVAVMILSDSALNYKSEDNTVDSKDKLLTKHVSRNSDSEPGGSMKLLPVDKCQQSQTATGTNDKTCYALNSTLSNYGILQQISVVFCKCRQSPADTAVLQQTLTNMIRQKRPQCRANTGTNDKTF